MQNMQNKQLGLQRRQANSRRQRAKSSRIVSPLPFATFAPFCSIPFVPFDNAPFDTPVHLLSSGSRMICSVAHRLGNRTLRLGFVRHLFAKNFRNLSKGKVLVYVLVLLRYAFRFPFETTA